MGQEHGWHKEMWGYQVPYRMFLVAQSQMKTRCPKLVKVSMFQHCVMLESPRDTLVMQTPENCILAGYFAVFWRGKHTRP